MQKSTESVRSVFIDTKRRVRFKFESISVFSMLALETDLAVFLIYIDVRKQLSTQCSYRCRFLIQQEPVLSTKCEVLDYDLSICFVYEKMRK